MFLVLDYRGRAASIEEVSSNSLFFISSMSFISLLLLSFRAILFLYFGLPSGNWIKVMLLFGCLEIWKKIKQMKENLLLVIIGITIIIWN